MFGPGWCGSVDWVPAYEAKGHKFDSQSGTCLGCRQVPSRGCTRSKQTLIFFSLFFSLPSPLSKNKFKKYFSKIIFGPEPTQKNSWKGRKKKRLLKVKMGEIHEKGSYIYYSVILHLCIHLFFNAKHIFSFYFSLKLFLKCVKKYSKCSFNYFPSLKFLLVIVLLSCFSSY